jgi:hypothetical protein
MDADYFWEVLDEILNSGEFVPAVPNAGTSANIFGKITISRDSREKVIDKHACHCHVHLASPPKLAIFFDLL